EYDEFVEEVETLDEVSTYLAELAAVTKDVDSDSIMRWWAERNDLSKSMERGEDDNCYYSFKLAV
ncbi:ATP-dependent zinc metalloprotease FtsH 2, partial [Frankliniella fusca]